MGFSADEDGALVDEQLASRIANPIKTLRIGDSNPVRPAEMGVWADPTGYSSAMADEDPRAKYRQLPPSVNTDDMVIEVDTTLAEVEQPGKGDYNNGADPYLRITGWKPSG